MRIICCKFGDKFTDWHVDNLKTYDRQILWSKV